MGQRSESREGKRSKVGPAGCTLICRLGPADQELHRMGKGLLQAGPEQERLAQASMEADLRADL